MKRTRLVLSGIAGMLAASAIAASSASAFPLFSGQTPNSGSLGLTIKPTIVETVGAHKIGCPSYETVYEVRSTERMHLFIILNTCTSKGAPCTSAGQGRGTIVLELEGRLGYVNRAKRQVGLLFGFASSASENLNCGGVREHVLGSMIGTISPVDKVVVPPEHFTLTFKQSKGIQTPVAFEHEEGPDSLYTSIEGGPEERTGFSWGTALTFSAEEAVVG
jgi:hypothetical protein